MNKQTKDLRKEYMDERLRTEKKKEQLKNLNKEQIFGDLGIIRSDAGGFEVWHRFDEKMLVWFNSLSISALRDLLASWSK